MAHYFKYHEEEILNDIREYVSGTYQGHYTGKSHEFRNVQTIDLMASKELASGFLSGKHTEVWKSVWKQRRKE